MLLFACIYICTPKLYDSISTGVLDDLKKLKFGLSSYYCFQSSDWGYQGHIITLVETIAWEKNILQEMEFYFGKTRKRYKSQKFGRSTNSLHAHNSLSHFFFCRTKKVDGFTSRLLDIHSKMLDMNKKEVFSFACIFWFQTNDLSCLYII